MKKNLFYCLLMSTAVFTCSANAGKLRIYLENRDVNSSGENFQRIHQQNKQVLVREDRENLPIPSHNYKGKDRAYFSSPIEQERFQEYTWYNAGATKVVVGYEDKEGAGRSQSFPFPWEKGFHAFTVNLPEEITNPKEQLEKVSLSVESVVLRYPEEITSNQYITLGSTAFHPKSGIKLKKDEEGDFFHQLAVIYYRKSEFGNILDLRFPPSPDHLYKQLANDGLQSNLEK
jgi:hypothetical protein